MRKFILLILITISYLQLHAQTTEEKAATTTPAANNTIAADGTFIFIRTSKIHEAFTTERLEEIRRFVAENRDQSRELILSVSEYTDVRIPPQSVVTRPDFRPYETLFED